MKLAIGVKVNILTDISKNVITTGVTESSTVLSSIFFLSYSQPF
jgi:hypothetical protein